MILQHDVLSENYIKGPAFNYNRKGWEIKQPAVLRCNQLFSVVKWEHHCIVDLLEGYKGRFKIHVCHSCSCYQSQHFFLCGIGMRSVTELRSTSDPRHCRDQDTGSACVAPQKHGVVWITSISKCASDLSNTQGATLMSKTPSSDVHAHGIKWRIKD